MRTHTEELLYRATGRRFPRGFFNKQARYTLCRVIDNRTPFTSEGAQDARRSREGVIPWNICYVWSAGTTMEDSLEVINAEVQAVKESRETLEQLANQVRKLGDVLIPTLASQVETIRGSRMTVVSEIQLMLGSLREIRKFFLESDYRTEIEHLERFVKLCQEIQKLKQSGVFDGVCDSIIRLAIKGEQDE